MNNNLKEYLRKALLRGLSISEIESSLAEKGWESEDVRHAAADAQAIIDNDMKGPLVVPDAPKFGGLNIDLGKVSASQILLYLGGLIVVIAGVIYIGINWSQWGSWMRIFAIFAPMMVCYLAGTFLWFGKKREDTGIVFTIVGSLLFPLFLVVTFSELELFAEAFSNELGLTVSSITFCLYVLLSLVFKFPVWAFLYQAIFLFVYFFFWTVLGFDEGIQVGFLFLAPAIMYSLLPWFYDMKQKSSEASYSYLLGGVVALFAFVILFGEGFEHEYVAWILMLLGFVFFGARAWIENFGYKKFASVPYFIGSLYIFVPMYRLAMEGDLLGGIVGGAIDEHSLVGWSLVASGVIYWIVFWILSKVKGLQVSVARGYGRLYEFASVVFILGGVWYLGLDGHKLVYETMLLIFSLGFIFGSIPRSSRVFLYFGTLFLIIYIFAIGSEYFQNDVGWPITLFIAGLLSMGVGVLIEKVKKRYFEKSHAS